jgi:hypothetical protein
MAAGPRHAARVAELAVLNRQPGKRVPQATDEYLEIFMCNQPFQCN